MTLADSMHVLLVNGAPTPLPVPEPTLAALLRGLGFDPDMPGVAVAHNGEVVPRRQWAEVVLAAQDEVEVVTAAQGG